MRIGFDLQHPALASYRWGSLYTHFSWFATPTKELINQVIRMLATNTAPWKNAIELRATISFLHEIIHYLQDVSTGIGHWDFLVRQEYLPQILAVSRTRSWTPSEAPYGMQEAALLASEMNENLIFVPFKYISEKRQRKLISHISALKYLSDIPCDREIDFSVEAMLEAEAAWGAVNKVFGLLMDDSQAAVLTNETGLFDLRSMGREYSAAYEYIEDLLSLTNTKTPVSRREALNVHTTLLSMLVDIACAHPSPALQRKCGVSLWDLSPPVRFVRMMHAFHTISEVDGRDFTKALTDIDYSKAEEVLLRKCKVKYPNSQEVYSDWKDQLRPFEAEDSTASIRITSCDRRLELPDRAGQKSLESLVLGKARGLPIYCHTSAGVLRAYFGWRNFPGGDEDEILQADMYRTDRDMRLAQLVIDGEAFSCPLSETNRCDVAQTRCRDGMSDLNLLPSLKECLIRDALTSAGWNIKGANEIYD
jgi:hypothetical protein